MQLGEDMLRIEASCDLRIMYTQILIEQGILQLYSQMRLQSDYVFGSSGEWIGYDTEQFPDSYSQFG